MLRVIFGAIASALFGFIRDMLRDHEIKKGVASEVALQQHEALDDLRKEVARDNDEHVDWSKLVRPNERPGRTP